MATDNRDTSLIMFIGNPARELRPRHRITTTKHVVGKGRSRHHICAAIGTVNQGTLAGATATPIATASSSTDTPAVATLRHGSNFSAAISPETTSIQVRLIAPSANSATIRAQQHPRHQAPCRVPIVNAPRSPSRHEPRRNPNGERHFRRHLVLIGVISYSAAAISAPTVMGRPKRSHVKIPAAWPALSAAYATSPDAVQTTR